MINEIKILIKKVILLIKKALSTSTSYFLFILFPLLSTVPVIFFFPFWAAASFVVQINVITTTALIYASVNFEYESSTLYDNEFLLKSDKKFKNASGFIVTLLFVLITSIIQFLFLMSWNELNLLMPNWLSTQAESDRGYLLTLMPMGAWFWSIFWTTTIVYLLFSVCGKWVSSKINFYSIAMIILTLSFVWGGSLNDYWGGSYQLPDGSYERELIRSLYPKELYWPTLILFPLYAPGQMASQTADFTIISLSTGQWDSFRNYGSNVIHLSFNTDWPNRKEWNWLVLMPVVWSAALFIFVFILNKTNKN